MGLLGGIVPVLVAVVACIGAYQLNIGQISKPGPGLWPFILSIALLSCSIINIIKSVRPDNYEKFTPKSKLVLYSLAAIAGFIVIMNLLGVVPAVIVLLLFQLRIVGAETWKSTVLVTAAMTVFVYVVFSLWLKIPFPGFFS